MDRDCSDTGWEFFLEICLKIKDKESFERFFDAVLTIEEKKDLDKRILIFKELFAGEHTQREIAGMLNTSIAKITRGSNCMKRLDDFSKDWMKKIFLEEK